MPDKVKELQAQWDAWNVSNVRPLWGGGEADTKGAAPGTPAKKKRIKGKKKGAEEE